MSRRNFNFTIVQGTLPHTEYRRKRCAFPVSLLLFLLGREDGWRGGRGWRRLDFEARSRDLRKSRNGGDNNNVFDTFRSLDGLIRIVRFPLPRIRPNSIRPRWYRKLRIRGAVGETPFAVTFSRFERFIVVRRSRRIFRLELFNSWKDAVALFQKILLEKRFSRVSNESSMYSRAFVYVRKREITRLFNRRFLLKCSCSILRSTFHPGPIARAIRTPHDSRFFYLEELARERSSRDDGII